MLSCRVFLIEAPRKVFKRMTPKAQRLLEDIDSLLGSTGHAFANITNLEVLCNKTACKQSNVSDELLEWILHGYLLGAWAAGRICALYRRASAIMSKLRCQKRPSGGQQIEGLADSHHRPGAAEKTHLRLLELQVRG